MNELQIFNNPEFGEVRTITEDGKTLFCGKDVAAALGYKRPADAINAHCKGSVIRRLPTKGGEQDVKFIPEGDIYRLAARSELPGADVFERWIFDEVLPMIRRTGAYAPQDATVQVLERVAGCMEVMMGQFATLSRKVDALEQRQGVPVSALTPSRLGPSETPVGFMDSMEVAHILGREHNNVLKSIRTVSERARTDGIFTDECISPVYRRCGNNVRHRYYRLNEIGISLLCQSLQDWTLAEKLRSAFREKTTKPERVGGDV